MRILGEINDLPYKVTALSMNNRISIKYEDGENEVTLKFRDGSIITDMEAVSSFVRQSGHLERVTEIFAAISKTRTLGVKGIVDQSDIDLPEII
jgi:hypothetical protein